MADQRNTISEGPERIQLPDQDGVIQRGPSPAIDELRDEVARAAAQREVGRHSEAVAISTIESRGDLREAAKLELPPTSTVDGPQYTKIDTSKELAASWADLDAAEFNRMRSQKRKELALETIAINVRTSPEYADALATRSPTLAAAAQKMNERLANVQVVDEAKIGPVQTEALRNVERSTDAILRMPRDSLNAEQAKVAVRDDIAALRAIEDADVRRIAARVMGQVADNHQAYRSELRGQSPEIAKEVADASKTEVVIDGQTRARLAELREQDTREVAAALAADREAAEAVLQQAQARADGLTRVAQATSADSWAREEAMDAQAQTLLARRRAEDSREATAALRAQLARQGVEIPADAPRQPGVKAAEQATRDAGRATPDPLQSSAGDERQRQAQASQREAEEEAADRARVIKRPIREDELPDALRKRFVISTEKAGVLDKGKTVFTYRGGDRDGMVAFQDAGKQLSTTAKDAESVRSMVAVVKEKGWKEATVSGEDEFRRRGWLELSLEGVKVHGYEPREADKKRLAELLAERAPTNTITSADREPTRDKTPEQGAQRQAPQQQQQAPRQGPTDREETVDVERLRSRLITDLGNRPSFDPEELAKRSEAHQDRDRRTEGEIPVDAQRRRQRDAQAIMNMSPAELVALAKVIDMPPTAASNQQLRRMIDGPSRHEPAYSADPKPQRAAEREVQRGRDVDGDSLTAKEKTALDAMRTVLKSQGYGPEFVAATVEHLERDLRRQRVHMGELIAHGPAPYKNDKDKEDSYFVTLKTPTGLETIWGKQLGKAIAAGEVRVGDQAVFVNTGKKPVEVDQRDKDSSGKTVVRRKDAMLNEWTAQPIDRIAAKDRAELNARQRRGDPVLQVFDPSAARQRQGQPREQDRAQAQSRDYVRQDKAQDGPER